MRLLQNLIALMTGLTSIGAQIVWARYVTRLLGASSWTIASVIAMSLLGLAIGNRWSGRQMRFGSSTRFASFMLLGLGISVLLLPAFFALATTVDALPALTVLPLPDGGGQGKLWILLVAAPALLVHFFAGAVFPALLHRHSSDAAVVGGLVAVETLGGCIGAALTECLLLESIGMRATLLAGGAATSVVALFGLMVAGDRGNRTVVPDTGHPQRQSIAIGRVLLAGIFLAGIASLGLEVIWQRLLVVLVGTDGYSLTIVIVAYLTGITVGAALATRWLAADNDKRANDWFMQVRTLQLTGALVSLAVLAAIVSLASGPGQAWLNAPLVEMDVPLLKRVALCCGLLVIPAAVYGASWPLLLRALVRRHDETVTSSTVAALAAQIYSVVAMGNVAGVVLTGFVLVPHFGLQFSLLILVMTTGVAAWLIGGAKIGRYAPALSVGVFGLVVVLAVRRTPVGIVNDVRHKLLYYREGPASTVAVLAESDRPDHRRLSVDGIVVGQSGDNVEEKQLLLAHLGPILLEGRQSLKNAAVIGLGTGILSRELAGAGDVQSVTSVELSPAVIEAAEQFADLVRPGRANTQTVQGDGVWWLKKQQQKFDAIISDGKSRPGHVGNSAFFSADYYSNAVGKLSAKGVFIQWVSLDADPSETRVVIKTFSRSFSHAYVAIATPNSLYLVGSKIPVVCDLEGTGRYFRSADLQPLNRYHWHSTDDLQAMGWIKMEADTLKGKSWDEVRINSLDRPLLEHASFDIRPETIRQNRVDNLQLLRSLLECEPKLGIFGESRSRQVELRQAMERMLEMARHEVQQNRGWVNRAAASYRAALEILPNLHRGQHLAKISLVAAAKAASVLETDREVDLLLQGASLSPKEFDVLMRVARRLAGLNRYEGALQVYLAAAECRPGDAEANRGAAESLVKIGKLKQSVRYFKAAGDDQRASETEKEFNRQNESADLPALPQPRTDEERSQRLLDLLRE